MKKWVRIEFILMLVVLAGSAGSLSSANGNAPAAKRTAPKRSTVTTQPKSTISPKANQIFRQMSDYLTSLQSSSVHVDTTREIMQSDGQLFIADRSADVWLVKPNKLRVNVESAIRNVQIYYNGDSVTIYSPKQNYYGIWPAPPTLDATIARARTRYGLILPLADLLVSNPYQRVAPKIKSSTYVGQAFIQGVLTNHLAFRQANVDWQIWVDAGNTPLPRRLIIIDKTAKGKPRMTATFTNWNTSPSIDPSIFVFTPPPGAKKIDVLQLPSVQRQIKPR